MIGPGGDWVILTNRGGSGNAPIMRQAREDATQRIDGAQGLYVDSVSNATNMIWAALRASRGFQTRVRDSDHALWMNYAGSNTGHYLGIVARNQAAAGNVHGVLAADVLGLACYYFRVWSFLSSGRHQIELMRGSINGGTKIYPAGAGTILTTRTVNGVGNVLLRFTIINHPVSGNPVLSVYETDSAVATLKGGPWYLLDQYEDVGPGQIVLPGYAGIVKYDAGVNGVHAALDGYRDRVLRKAA